jgi:DeoR family fructose operon transcriptional repressor
VSEQKWAFREERLDQILKVIQENSSVSVSDLAKQFEISESTIRLDLSKLEAGNFITRTHGGAMSRNERFNKNILNLKTINERMTHCQEEKDAIGRKAASLIEDGDTVLIDGGSTTNCVVQNLANKHNLTIITNSLLIIQQLISNPEINVFSLGGLALNKHGVLVGALANQSLKSFVPNKTILGIDAISVRRGLMAADPSVPGIAEIKTEMINASHQLIIVCDHTKFNQVCPLSVAPIDAVDIIITDSNISEATVKEFSDKGVNVIIAD